MSDIWLYLLVAFSAIPLHLLVYGVATQVQTDLAVACWAGLAIFDLLIVGWLVQEGGPA